MQVIQFSLASPQDGEASCQVANSVYLVLIVKVFPDGEELVLVNYAGVDDSRYSHQIITLFLHIATFQLKARP